MGDANGNTNVQIKGEFTVNMATQDTVLSGEKLRLTLDWNGYNQQNLPININWDAVGWVYHDGSSHLETPEPTPSWPTFLSFDHEQELTFRAFNEGPEGIWFVFSGTRLVLTTNDGLQSHAAFPRFVNHTTATSLQIHMLESLLLKIACIFLINTIPLSTFSKFRLHRLKTEVRAMSVRCLHGSIMRRYTYKGMMNLEKHSRKLST